MKSLLLMFAAATVVLAGQSESPIACNLGALTAAEREQQAQITKRLGAAVQKIEELPDGYKIHLGAQFSTEDLLRFVQLEQRCCPFLDFEIGLARENGARWVQMTGRKGVKEFLAAEFKLKSAR